MPLGVPPNDIFHNGRWYARDGTPLSDLATTQYALALRRPAFRDEATKAPLNRAPLWAATTAIQGADVVRTSTDMLLVAVSQQAAATCTAALAAATSATLTVAWAGATGSYQVLFSDTSTRTVTFTAGLTAISWTGAVTATASLAVIPLTSGAEPTQAVGATPASIADGTVTWWPVGQASRLKPSDQPAITCSVVAGNSALANVVNPYDSAASFEQTSAPNVYTEGGSGSIKYCTAWAFSDGSTNDYGFGANGRQGKYRCIRFTTDADLFEIGGFAFQTGFANESVIILVDGWSITEAPQRVTTTPSSFFYRVSIPGSRRKRVITVMVHGRTILRYVATAAGCSITPPEGKTPLLGWWSDSFGDTESPGLSSVHFDTAPQVARRLGFPQVACAGVGGTSYSLDNGTRKSLQTLLDINDWSGYNFDAMLVAHGYNAGQAVGGATPAVEAAAALASWQKLRELAPQAPILIYNVWYTKTGADIATETAMSAALLAQFLAWGDPNSAIINPLDGSIVRGTGTYIRQATTAWFNTGNAGWTIGVDTAHPTPLGARYLQDNMVYSGEIALQTLGT
jgi:hypothetical protein